MRTIGPQALFVGHLLYQMFRSITLFDSIADKLFNITDYGMLMVAEALGSSNASQVVDLYLNNDNMYTPGYAIYENGEPSKVLLLNYMADSSGASDLIVNVVIGGGNFGALSNSAKVSVRYLAAPMYVFRFSEIPSTLIDGKPIHWTFCFIRSVYLKNMILPGLGSIWEGRSRPMGGLERTLWLRLWTAILR